MCVTGNLLKTKPCSSGAGDCRVVGGRFAAPWAGASPAPTREMFPRWLGPFHEILAERSEDVEGDRILQRFQFVGRVRRHAGHTVSLEFGLGAPSPQPDAARLNPGDLLVRV